MFEFIAAHETWTFMVLAMFCITAIAVAHRGK
jgi:hypothetical protein